MTFNDVALCVVCEKSLPDVTSETHACRQCENFFARSTLSGTLFVCQKLDGMCNIAVQSKKCRSCRLKKCQSVGMQPHWMHECLRAYSSNDRMTVAAMEAYRFRLRKRKAANDSCDRRTVHHPVETDIATFNAKSASIPTSVAAPTTAVPAPDTAPTRVHATDPVPVDHPLATLTLNASTIALRAPSKKTHPNTDSASQAAPKRVPDVLPTPISQNATIYLPPDYFTRAEPYPPAVFKLAPTTEVSKITVRLEPASPKRSASIENEHFPSADDSVEKLRIREIFTEEKIRQCGLEPDPAVLDFLIPGPTPQEMKETLNMALRKSDQARCSMAIFEFACRTLNKRVLYFSWKDLQEAQTLINDALISVYLIDYIYGVINQHISKIQLLPNGKKVSIAQLVMFGTKKHSSDLSSLISMFEDEKFDELTYTFMRSITIFDERLTSIVQKSVVSEYIREAWKLSDPLNYESYICKLHQIQTVATSFRLFISQKPRIDGLRREGYKEVASMLTVTSPAALWKRVKSST